VDNDELHLPLGRATVLPRVLMVSDDQAVASTISAPTARATAMIDT